MDKLNNKDEIWSFALKVIAEINQQSQRKTGKEDQKEEGLPLLAKLAIGGAVCLVVIILAVLIIKKVRGNKKKLR